ncbi:hypothetical protein LCGC14_1985550 [marine sediment metagenome]|uniref:Uncharacterized protein n=1 Tax=marine sediment metagenome TaxID=412755 RepID=A0A0F9FVP6_9ZZZZ
MAQKQNITNSSETDICENAKDSRHKSYCSYYSEWSFPDRPGEQYCYYCACDIAEHGDIMLRKVSQRVKENE